MIVLESILIQTHQHQFIIGPDGNNSLIYSNVLTKSNLNHFVYNDYFSVDLNMLKYGL